MSKLLITTQVEENYGAHDWDGTGSCPQYWKFKGGHDYVVLNVDECDMIDCIVDRIRGQIEVDNQGFREYIIGYSIKADDYLTEFEKSQLEYEGKITYPAREILVDNLAA
jgi:hypothetical protein